MKYLVGAVAVTCALFIQFAGCRKNSVEPNWSDSDFFSSVVGGGESDSKDLANGDFDALRDDAMYSIPMRQDGPSIQSVNSGDLVPSAWGRYIEHVSRTVTTEFDRGDTVVTAHASVTLTGDFVIVGTVNGVQDTVRKPYSETFVRNFRFLRVAKTLNARKNWVLDAVSILNGSTTNPGMTIKSINVTTPNQTNLSVTDPDNYFMQVTRKFMHSFPVWPENSTVTVTATVHSNDTDSDLVYIHHLQRKQGGPHRVAMMKVSETPAVGGGFDRVYSVTLAVPDAGRHFGAVVVSAATSETLFSSDPTKIAGAVWGVPYKTSE